LRGAARARSFHGAMPHATAVDPALTAAIIDLSADAIITMAPDETITSWNRGAEALFGWTAGETVGRHFAMLLPREELARGELDWIRATTEEQGAIADFETRRRRKDGTIFEVSLTRTAVYSEAKQVIGYSAVLRDISYRKRLERQLLAAERLATAGQVAAGVAHEIGAPITAITMVVEHLERLNAGHEARAAQLGILRSQTDRIAKLARDLVQIAKPPGLAKARLDVREPVEGACTLLAGLFERSGVRLTTDLAGSLPQVLGDRTQLQHVIVNLLLNAQRAIGERGGAITVTARPGGGGAAVEITVSDTGSGIAPEDLPHVFTPFFSRTGGSGLGLAIADQIVSAHHGTLEAASPDDGGATFTIRLPAGTSDD
jgi:PAS domain S-box-containing protein